MVSLKINNSEEKITKIATCKRLNNSNVPNLTVEKMNLLFSLKIILANGLLKNVVLPKHTGVLAQKF